MKQPAPLLGHPPHFFRFALGLAALLVAAVYYKLGVQPLFFEEPRRAMVALEMLYRDNFLVPTTNGELYYKKTPVYNWLIILGFKTFDSYKEFAIRFYSTLSYLLTGLLVYWGGRRYVSKTYGVYAAFFFLLSADLFYYFSAMGEIDLFYMLVSYAGMVLVFHFHRRKQWHWLFLSTYFLHAVGTLTKGLPSPLFQGFTLLAYLAYQRDLKKLLHPWHFAGIGLYLLIVGGYFYLYSLQHDPIPYFMGLYLQSEERSFFEYSIWEFLLHLVEFPLAMLKNILPASLFLPFLFQKNLLQKIKEQPYIAFCAIAFLANVWLYWISPGNNNRYTYMLLPLLTNVLVYVAYAHSDALEWYRKLFPRLIQGIFVLGGAGLVALPFFPFSDTFPNIAVAGPLLGVLLWVCAALIQGYRRYTALLLVLGLVVGRFAFNEIVFYLRDSISFGDWKRAAYDIHEIVGEKPLYIHNCVFVALSTRYFLEVERGEIVPCRWDTKKPGYYLVEAGQLKGRNYQPLYKLKHHQSTYHLAYFGKDKKIEQRH